MKLKSIIILLSVVILTALTASAVSPSLTNLGRPDLDSIKIASCDPASKYYYPTLLKKFMANDTTMTDTDFQYFYYGTMFQEDYDPYRPTFRQKQYETVRPLYIKPNQSRAEKQMILDYALAALDDNPVNIQQLVHRIDTYQKIAKYDLAKIWQYKLNHLLLVIASSGTGLSPEDARIVVYPEHEYDFLNLAGMTATDQKFVEPWFDCITATPRTNSEATNDYYFNIVEMLRQYFLKHPSELHQEQSE